MRPSLLAFVQTVVAGDIDAVSRDLASSPAFATAPLHDGATHENASEFFLPTISHYVYKGDTALHVAAAAFHRPIAELLIAAGADCRARNRRGAEPLHYAADTNHWNPAAQADVIAYLIAIGADPNATDASGVAPLHRAVRTRSLAAVRALVLGGANIAMRNKSGSTPMDLAEHNTGRGGSGSARSRQEQVGIVQFLLERGAVPGGRKQFI